LRNFPQALRTAENIIGVPQYTDHDIRWRPLVILETFRPVKREVSLFAELAIADLDIGRYACGGMTYRIAGITGGG